MNRAISSPNPPAAIDSAGVRAYNEWEIEVKEMGVWHQS